MLHVAMAVNRFTAFYCPLTQSYIWRRRNVLVWLLCIVLTSLLLHVVPQYVVPRLIGCTKDASEYDIDDDCFGIGSHVSDICDDIVLTEANMGNSQKPWIR